jgi:TPR repeat protein
MNNVPQDPEKAKEMYSKAVPGLEKAAADGDASACCALANMYATGKGVDKDEAKAKEIYEKPSVKRKKKSEAARKRKFK